MLRLMIQALKVVAVLALAAAIVVTAQRALSHYLSVASANASGEPITFVVEESESVDSVAARLHEADLIRSATYFKLRMRLTNRDSQLKAGRFELRKGMTVNEIINTLTTAEGVEVVQVRFQEGWRAEEYADKLVEVGLISTPEQFLDAIRSGTWDREFLGSRPSGASLEGYLFPDTYEFRADATPEDVINTLLDTFDTRVPAELRARAQALGYNFHQVMVIASIIEREAVVPEERPLIASVYYNRLRAGMPLQADPTVQYALGQPGNWWPTVTDPNNEAADSPYNTYTHPDIPPGPICNPGLAAIEAALQPAQTDYLYFVAKGDGSGTHAFARTLDEHNANIQQYTQP
ncbi:MAG: endolytic transglycosylase MltG [Sphaerobacter sp.]|nr:endolytic transglycosylase MltG [Sphaerobacter sp.]